MKTIDLDCETPSVNDLCKIASVERLIVRTPEGKFFEISQLNAMDELDDFDDEVRRTSQNKELMEFMDKRRKADGPTYSTDDLRKEFGLDQSPIH